MPTILSRQNFQLLIVVSVAFVIMATEVSPQTRPAGGLVTEERFKTIRLNNSDPEVQEARRRQLTNPILSQGASRMRFGPLKSDNRFLVDLDDRGLSIVARHYGARVGKSAELIRRSKQISYDQPGNRATAFVVNYPLLNAQLRCYWVYDHGMAKAVSELRAKAREVQLDGSVSASASEKSGQNLKIAPKVLPPADSWPAFSEEDPGLGQLLRVRRQFKKGGRPCQLEVICFAKFSSEQTFAERFHSMRRVRSVCKARADALANALIVVRTGN